MLDRLSQPSPSFALPNGQVDAYNMALRHSARVRKLKVILPLGAAIISLSFMAVSLARTWMPDEVTLESSKVENGKIVMEKPALAGRNNKGFDYSMNAERALQDIASPNLMTLEKVLAAVPMNDIVAQVVAQEGLFDRTTNRLQMTAPFDINLSNGLQAKFQSANVDLKAGTMDTDKPVSIKTKEGSIDAESLRIADNGKTITFSGQVRARIAASTIQNAGK
ncbi:LPS export ABC transporter periplasmic protein LptC [Agrobacterium rubi]|jgi:lipopolysaccharide export system protein LptC|uniref:LPS export ABC transporter periplasmic protein LptC n=1 Tax=Agrobacterium rubi TR3 = NBRC 13261 TaxID=1368415 RepID=A0A081CV81_9HYPH|nr:LPS export ABC transporter periplasmic protein LptC [Agrobacterium rubi]MBP1879434.1 lipopolysaccharide export system protein LptC [Agrobacterium rubi]MCL6653360.1 LPS export ABC transporter periplasmic protein LptC [Agrobacterium rubi]NTF06113.1 LPS export ABC transporter periplasmic protein LptC [Agrobacterium rubi]NTF18354.1 LPS export ABC transporter periplasmic protein LptC [Agrobacterium rubi]NTF25318.1 LPS export ABC transporter periplasmic protein LptC [Agrobacterium rubi]